MASRHGTRSGVIRDQRDTALLIETKRSYASVIDEQPAGPLRFDGSQYVVIGVEPITRIRRVASLPSGFLHPVLLFPGVLESQTQGVVNRHSRREPYNADNKRLSTQESRKIAFLAKS